MNNVLQLLLVNEYLSLDDAYNIVANNNTTTINNIKKSITYIIRINWSTIKDYNKLDFDYNSLPTNKEFIYILSECIKKEFYYK